jgi:3'-phosphoadenosine 5'-phosphosulfate sulfotransferase (PAPS reductase)/FAD synthetase
MKICWWSGGITSAVACKLAIDQYGKDNCKVIMLDTMNEHYDTYRFLKDCEAWYGLPIELLRSENYENIEETWFKHLSLNTAKGAICSYMLKRRVREQWEKTANFTNQVYGFEYSPKEIKRAKAFTINHGHTNPIYPLIDAKMDKDSCIKYVRDNGIEIPLAYSMGYHNNNCLNTGCVQGGIGYWKKIQKEMPELFDKMAKVEHDLTNKKGVPVTMLKDQSNKAKIKASDWKYANLVFLKPHFDYPDLKSLDDMMGRKVKPLNDCNGFCGTNDLIGRNETENELNIED